jgi:teichuronic acid biosynthesis glycosyltransferase TuaH
LTTRIKPQAAIIVPSYNQYEKTLKPCLESIFQSETQTSFIVVVVDNGSDEETKEFIKSAAARYAERLIPILFDENRGYGAANNAGLKAVDAPFYVLLNNDTQVTDHWLDRLIDFLEHNQEIGLVGPASNRVGNEQQIPIPEGDSQHVIALGRAWADESVASDYHWTDRLGFFCVAMRREVLERIGFFDEAFGIALFEDDDYCLRTALAGFKLAWLENVFVYHQGSASLSRLGLKIADGLWKQNLMLLEAKHGIRWSSAWDATRIAKVVREDLERFALEPITISHAILRLQALQNDPSFCAKAPQDSSYNEDDLKKQIHRLEAAIQMINDQEPGISRRIHSVSGRMNLEDTVTESLNFLSKGSRYILFGCGSYGKIVSKVLTENGFAFSHCFDNSSNLWRKSFESVEVQAPRYIEDGQVIIATQYADDVREQLLDLGYSYHRLISFENGPLGPSLEWRARQVIENMPDGQRKGIGILLHRFFSWNASLYQRPQQMARALGTAGVTYFYSATSSDRIAGIASVGDRCFVTQYPELFEEWQGIRVYHYYSTDFGISQRQVNRHLNEGHRVLYEYVDAISDDITGVVPDQVRKLHTTLLEDERVKVVATAQQLLEDVQKHRSRNYCLITNGVDLPHFYRSIYTDETPSSIGNIVASGNSTICYYGSLAGWIDYPLLLALAEARPDINILLIGVDYDGSIHHSNLTNRPNIYVLPPVPYADLPKYVSRADIFMVPFLLNELTHCTSPIKLFEYMAMGKPIITTGMRECRKYRSVLIGENQEDFIQKVALAEKLRNDQKYKDLLLREAEENSWASKAKTLLDFLSSSSD